MKILIYEVTKLFITNQPTGGDDLEMPPTFEMNAENVTMTKPMAIKTCTCASLPTWWPKYELLQMVPQGPFLHHVQSYGHTKCHLELLNDCCL